MEIESGDKGAARNGPKPLAILKDYGISDSKIESFKRAGYHTVQAVQFVPRETLLKIPGISENSLDKVL